MRASLSSLKAEGMRKTVCGLWGFSLVQIFLFDFYGNTPFGYISTSVLEISYFDLSVLFHI